MCLKLLLVTRAQQKARADVSVYAAIVHTL